MILKLLDYLLEIIYPTICIFCGKINKDGICIKCQKQIELKYQYKDKINERYILNKYFTKHIYLFPYEEIIRQKIIDLKFNQKPYIAKGLANFLIKNKKVCRLLKSYDIIIPVPIHKKRKRQRGYNQTQLIAKEIVKKIPTLRLENNILIKIKNNKPQSTLDAKQRGENILNAYKIQYEERIKGKKILVLDDIYTTGNTLNECSKMLKQSGAKIVDVLTIAKD